MLIFGGAMAFDIGTALVRIVPYKERIVNGVSRGQRLRADTEDHIKAAVHMRGSLNKRHSVALRRDEDLLPVHPRALIEQCAGAVENDRCEVAFETEAAVRLYMRLMKA
jgi:hypothetical protein